MIINGKTGLYGIIGDPVDHSLSPAMHNAAFAAAGINGVYLPIRPFSLPLALSGLRALGFRGISVTVPFKVEIMPLLDEIDPVARQIGAVNTLVFTSKEASHLPLCTGYNTDWVGANQALAEELDLANSTVLIIGAGGAARAVGFGLRKAGANVLLTNRTETRGRHLAQQLGCDFVPTGELDAIRAEGMVNTTSVGMSPHDDALPIHPDLLPHFSVVMDIVYAPLATKLLREASARGLRTVDGLKMLEYQAIAQFRLWTGRTPPTAIMRKALLAELSKRKECPR
jgi:shikimate dehydrogenase